MFPENFFVPKTLIALVGLPATGKTEIRDTLLEHLPAARVVSSDDLIEAWAKEHGITYSEAHGIMMKEKLISDGDLVRLFHQHIADGAEYVIWDQTNLSNARQTKLTNWAADMKWNIRFIVSAMPITESQWEEHSRRLASRPGKTIPDHTITDMISWFEEPENDEITVTYDTFKGY